MKKVAIGGILIGFILGAASVVGIVLYSMSDGTPFRSMAMKYGIENGMGIIFSDRFVVVYEGMDGHDAGSGGFNYAGKHGTLPAFWAGYGLGWSGGPTGIETMSTYEPGFGTAIFYFHGKLVRVEDDGRYVRIQNQLLPLGSDRIVAFVNKEGFCRPLSGEEADKLLEKIPAWYRDPEMNSRPPQIHVPDQRDSQPNARSQ